MRRIDELFLKYPFYGARQMARHLRREGVRIGRRGPATRIPSTGCGPICSRACGSSGRTMSGAPTSPTSRCSAASSTWWRSWTGRAATSWPGGCRTRWTRASVQTRWRRPWRATARQRSSTPTRAASSTSFAFTGRLREAGIRISMDGRGRCMDNIFIERLWRSLKYEAVYLHEIADGFTARRVGVGPQALNDRRFLFSSPSAAARLSDNPCPPRQSLGRLQTLQLTPLRFRQRDCHRRSAHQSSLQRNR